jgi:polyisoprenoid-binding protein YceI
VDDDPDTSTRRATTVATSTFPSELTGTYTIDPVHSRIGFVARHAMVTKVHGSFDEFEGSGYFDAANPAASHLELTIHAKSIDTRHPDRDAHLRSNDFFDMDKYPTITFVSTAVERTDDTTFRVTGDLTVKDVTRPITIDFEYGGAAVDPFDNHRIGFEGTATINRKDWGVNWNAVLEADISAIKTES